MGHSTHPASRIRDALDRSAFGAGRGERPHSRLISGSPDQVWSVIRRLRAGATREYASFDDPGYLVRSGVAERIIALGPSTMRPMIERGVAVRQITTRSGLQLDGEFGTILWSQGAAARVVQRLPFKAGVIDRSIALLPADLSVFANGMLVVTDPIVVRLILAQHTDLWRAGGTVAPADGPPEHLRPLLPALLSGDVDSTAAAAAGLSMRTFSRRVAELLVLLGARSRFQAGVEAARRGWL